mgnify:CR=1 FL=1
MKRRRKRSAAGSPWARMSREIRLVADRCAICPAPSEVVHHLRYRGKRGVSEHPQDLVPLCRHHHDDLHRQGFDGPVKFIKYRDRMRLIEALLAPANDEEIL